MTFVSPASGFASVRPAFCAGDTLGATLYMPATRPDLADVIAGAALPGVRSVVFCLEDAIRANEVAAGLRNLGRVLRQMMQGRPQRGPAVFVRPRSPKVLQAVRRLPGSEILAGYVLPKIDAESLLAWLPVLDDLGQQMLMPTLETAEVFDPAAMRALRAQLDQSFLRDHVLTLRIGGNDLLNTLGLRRPRRGTLYDGPLGQVIGQLVTIFMPAGFTLTAPVCERLDDVELLQAELARDLDHGLVGKTAVHPRQVPLIDTAYRVAVEDLEAAEAILAPEAPAVFRLHGAMCEPATHARWARQVLRRAAMFGCDEAPSRRHAVA